VGGSGLSGPSGVFGLVLDPAVYRLEVEASAGYPVFRTFVRVPATGVQLDPIVLRPGRSLTALVVRENGTVVTQALVRIYHRISVDGGADRALLLGEGVSDGNGRVTILLPQQ